MIKIYKVKQMSGTEIPIVGRETLDALMAAANAGVRLIETQYGVINPSSIDSIVLDIDKMNHIAEEEKFGYDATETLKGMLGPAKMDVVETKALPKA